MFNDSLYFKNNGIRTTLMTKELKREIHYKTDLTNFYPSAVSQTILDLRLTTDFVS